jgi:hypothetical protein
MKLYFQCEQSSCSHFDRLDRLRENDIVDREPYFNETPLCVMSPFFDADFLEHFNTLCNDGLSAHGARYLIQSIRGEIRFAELLIELYFEYVRYRDYPDKPSRFQSFFAFEDLSKAKEFGNGRGKIYEIDYSGSIFIGDMNWLKISYNAEMQRQCAEQYWSGKAFAGKKPNWECLLNLPIEIKKEVRI